MSYAGLEALAGRGGTSPAKASRQPGFFIIHYPLFIIHYSLLTHLTISLPPAIPHYGHAG
jgi:hypothetical protein